MYLNAKPNPREIPGIDMSQPEHPVTEKMTADANKLALKPAPEFIGTSVREEPVQISGNQDKPQFVLFILDGCPCSIDAQPIFNGLSKHWKGKVDFYGVIDSEQKKARAWTSDYRAAFPVVSDPSKKLIKAYEAKQSVYCALISKEGKIVKLWPGYSSGMLKEMNELIAKELEEKPTLFDTQYAPVDKTSGCFF